MAQSETTKTLTQVLESAPVFGMIIDADNLQILSSNTEAQKTLDAYGLTGSFLSDLFILSAPLNPSSEPMTFNTVDKKHQIKATIQAVDDRHWLIWGIPDSNSNGNNVTGKLQRDFVSTVSHEFRTPLTSIKGFADTMLSYGENLKPDQQKRFITIIKNQADRMIRLTENLLTVSKLDEPNGRLSFRPIEIKPLLEHLVETLMMKHKEQFPVPVSVNVMQNAPPVWADSDSLEQVLLNLIDNAIKYSAKCQSPSVNIKVTLAPDDDSRIRIAITDNGIGMTQTQLDNLFHKFYRAESPLTQQIEGTGLGLYITRSLINAMDGNIDVTSVEGEGSTFMVTLPVATAECQALYQKRRVAEDREEGIPHE